MPTLDHDHEQVVIRIAYDGPAQAGKTTSLIALANSLGQELYSGDQAEGRTLFFDWLEYLGGRFDGLPIRCQILSVPGQRALASRRFKLLETADAVVFVVGSRPEDLDRGLESLRTLQAFLSGVAKPTPGIVVQANKRDEALAVPLDDIRKRLVGDSPFAINPTTATDGVGIRETFVFAVRLALERVRAMNTAGTLPEGAPAVEDAASLLSVLLESEDSVEPIRGSLSKKGTADDSPKVRRPKDVQQPRELSGFSSPATPQVRPEQILPEPPSPDVPVGMTWPPVEGRVILHEVAGLGPQPKLLSDGAWGAKAGHWQLRSSATHSFSNRETVRETLVAWARWHSTLGPCLSAHRCLVAAKSSLDSWRIWQIVRQETALSHSLRRELANPDPEAVAHSLISTAAAFLETPQRLISAGLPCTLASLARSGTGTVYVGFVPPNPLDPAMSPTAPTTLRAALRPLLKETLPAMQCDILHVLGPLQARASARGLPSEGEMLTTLLIELG